MNRLIHHNIVPYGGGFVINEPQRGIVGQGMNFNALLRSVKEWRHANSVPIGLGFEEEVERVVCEKHPNECVDGPFGKPRKTKLSLSTVLRGTQVLLSFKMAGSPYVSQDEAERRAAICASCPWNLDYAKPCGGNCGGLKEMVASIVGGQATPYDGQLKSCGICGCVAKAHVWIPNEFLVKGITPEMKEQFAAVSNCWKQL